MSTPDSNTLSEHASKQLLRTYDIPFAAERLVADASGAARAARELGFPVVAKLCGDAIAHKSERNLVRLSLGDAAAVEEAAEALFSAARPEDGPVEVLIAEQVAGRRELIVGMVRDPQFGPCVLLGLGGVLAEALADVVFARAPLSLAEARALPSRLSARKLLEAPFRGEPALDLEALAQILVSLGQLAADRPDVASVDLNPIIVCEGRPVAVDALIELGDPIDEPQLAEVLSDSVLEERFRPLFHPRGVIVAGVSGHPGKFGFVTLHNLLRFGFRGNVFPIKPDAAEVLGRPTLPDISEVPDGAADLVFVCTPNKVTNDVLRAAASKGARAAFVASAGYGEAGDEGKRLQRELVETANALGMVLIGPNGQGVISTAESMCAQIVAPYPPAGRIGVASQSGNLVSSFLNYSVASGVGVSKAVSLGNSAQTGLPEMLEYFAADPETDVALCYIEGLPPGRDGGERFVRALRRLTATKPLVVVKGGAAAEGQRAAASHTGALASDDRVFDGVLRQSGALRAPSVEHAFEWAATLATQPLPAGRRTIVFTSVGGWGVLAADACAGAGLELIALPEDLRKRIDAMVPARWSRANPIDLAGGETRDTIPELLEALCAHSEVDAIVHLGLGIQSGQAGVFRSGEFFPDHGLERIAGYHETQDRRYAEAARDASERHGVPVLCATELVVAERDNAGPRSVRETGRVCYPSAHRAVSSLRALADYAEFRRRV